MRVGRALLPVATLGAVSLAAGACSDSVGSGLEGPPTAAPEMSRIVLQAVDAGTGGPLADPFLTVRHLVRYPITLDETGSDAIPVTQTHTIQHSVAHDSLAVEVRLEAESYHRIDTVLSVARGGSSGPMTVRMTRRLDRAAGGQGNSTAEGGAGVAPPSSGGDGASVPSLPRPGADEAAGGTTGDPDAGMDRAPLRRGDQAFARGDWAQAAAAYRSMPSPPRRIGAYAREYTQGLVRLGESELALGNWQGALSALESAVGFDAPGYRASLLLAHARCATGGVAGGRQALEQLQRTSSTIPQAQRATALALVEYYGGICSQLEVEAVTNPRELLRAGTGALAEFQTFLDAAEALPAPSPEVSAAMDDARRRQDEVRARLRGGG
ncbi:MAG: hypothetical protein WEA09_09645 [Gemmatimonadota bacterium]